MPEPKPTAPIDLCPACGKVPKADGRARCLDCMEGAMRRLTNANRTIAAKEDGATPNRASKSPVRATPADYIAVNWSSEAEIREWGKIPDAACKPKPKDARRKPGRKRNEYFPKDGLASPPDGVIVL